MLKIYHSKGARSVRVIWLCEEMGVPYETAEGSFFKPSEDFLAVNPLRTIPALVDGDVTMIESVAIMLYIIGKHGPTDLAPGPTDPNYGDFLQFLMFGEAGIAAYANPLIATRFLAPEGEKTNWTTDYLRKTFERRFKFLGNRLEQAPYLVGGRFTAADISVGYVISMAGFAGVEDLLPQSLKDYHAGLAERPAYQRAAAVA